MRKLAIIILTSVIPLYVFGSAGINSGAVLEQMSGARGSGMGEANTASGSGVNGMEYNPGALAEMQGMEILMNYRNGYVEDNYGGILFGMPIGENSGIGVGIKYYTTGDISALNTLLEEETFTGESDLIVTAGYGMKVLEGFSAGIAIKYLNTTIAGEMNLNTIAGDIGVVYEHNFIRGGISLQNLGLRIGNNTGDEGMPLVIRGGISGRLKEINWLPLEIAVDLVNYSNDEGIKVQMGGEYKAFENLAIRGGYMAGYDERTFTAGIGIKIGLLSVDYSYVNGTVLNGSNRVTINYVFGEADSIKK